jgi:ribosome biogenesis GTPase
MGKTTDAPAQAVQDARTGRVTRIDRGWSTVLLDDSSTARVRNIGADVAVGDRVSLDADSERIASVEPRTSALTRRNSFEGARAVRQVVASNIDTVFVVHAVTTEPNPRRLERELVLAFDSGADPIVVLTKIDLVDPGYVTEVRDRLAATAVGVPILAVSSTTGEGLDRLRELLPAGFTVALIGASGAGKSTLVNALVGQEVQRTAEVRDDDQRGRHTTVAAELIELPWGAWLLDTPGLRAVTLWMSGRGIEMAFPEVFAAADGCRFRDCKHADEPGCAVTAAIAAGTIRPERLESLRRLVAEEFSVEEETIERERSMDRRGVRRPRRD